MKIKKFVAGSMSECLLQVKKELGSDAVILDSRKHRRGGPFSFLLADLVEVVAAVEGGGGEVHGRDAHATSGGAGAAIRQLKDTGSSGLARTARSGTEGALKVVHGRDGTKPPFGSHGRDAHATGTGEIHLGGQVAWAGQMQLGGQVAVLSDEVGRLQEAVGQITDHLKFRQLPSLPRELEALHRNLLENGVEERVAQGLTQELTLQLSGTDFENRPLLQEALHERIGKLVKAAAVPAIPTVAGSADGRAPRGAQRTGTRGGRVIMLVGPTGVGKTTTLAKMATHGGIYGRRRVGLVSADTYRMAAVEQLKTFAAIAELPLEAVYRPADMGSSVERLLGGCEVVLIDTAGRSPQDGGQMRDLLAFIEYARPDEVHLVLSMGTRLEDQLEVVKKFAAVKPGRLIFTKLDETTSYGAILNVCAGLGSAGLAVLPVSALTCGQEVPDDILCATQRQLVRLVSERGYYQELRKSN